MKQLTNKGSINMTHYLKVTEEEYVSLRDENAGFCSQCGTVNYDFHEPDAVGYHCDTCDSESSDGVEMCLVMGLVDLQEVS